MSCNYSLFDYGGMIGPGSRVRVDAYAEALRQTITGESIVLDIGTGRLVEELVRQSKLHIIALQPDRDEVPADRRRFDRAGLYGSRVHVLPGDIFSVRLPPYMAALVVSERLPMAGEDEAGILGIWRRKLAWVREAGGLAQIALHAEPHLADRCLGAYRGILEEIASDRHAWRANLGSVARWWEETRGHG